MLRTTTQDKPKQKKSFLLLSACIATALAQSPVFAQTDQDVDASKAELKTEEQRLEIAPNANREAKVEEAENEMIVEEVRVTGIRRSLDIAADVKRESNVVVDAITAQDIGLFSDNNIGEALNRIPGVQLERDAGEGYRVSIRGLGPRFVRTTINGRTALSPSGGEDSGDDARGFTFNIMPSEVVSGATVAKSTQAYDLEGGIGGTVDLKTNRPLDFANGKDNGFYVSGTGRLTYNDLSEDYLGRGTLFLNKKFGDNFAVFFAATIDQADRIDNLAESQLLRTNDHDLKAGTLVNGVVLPENLNNQNLSSFAGVRYQEQPISRDRNTYVTGLQWQSDNWDVNFDWTHGSEDELRDDKRFWINFVDATWRFEENLTSLTVDTGDEALDQSVPTLGTITGFEFVGSSGSRIEQFTNGLYRRLPRSSDINVGGLNVAWNRDSWTIVGDIGYADQDTNRVLERLRTRLDRGQDRFDNGVSGSYDIATSGFPIALVYDSFGVLVDPMDTSHQKFNLLERRVFNEKAEDTSFRLDFTKSMEERNNGDLISFFDALKFGVTWNKQKFSRDAVGKQYDGPAFDLSGVGSAYGRNILPDVKVPGFMHEFAVADIDDPLFESFLDDPSGYHIEQAESFDLTEENTGAYLQGDFFGEGKLPYRGNVGIRYVETDQTNVGWVGQGQGDDFIPADPDNPQVTTKRSYSEWLPSFNLAFDIAEDKVLRFAANKSLTRPDPLDMASRLDLGDLDSGGDNTATGGNPDLKPYTTYNYDLSMEWYPEIGGSYGVGVFYKELTGFIARGRSPELVGVSDGAGGIEFVEYDVQRPVNTDGGTITGIELQFHTPLDFLPGFWQYFGIQGSYTYVDAKMDAVVPDRNVLVSLRGTSEHSGNLVAYFEKDRFGVRVAASYRDDYLFQEAEADDRFDEWTKGSTIIDVNLDYLITDWLKVRFSANNVTNEQRGRFWNTPGAYYSDLRDNGRMYVLELRFTSD